MALHPPPHVNTTEIRMKAAHAMRMSEHVAIYTREVTESLSLAGLEIDTLRDLIREFVSDDDCDFDHHGDCQAHMRFGYTECPHAKAKRFIAQWDKVTP